MIIFRNNLNLLQDVTEQQIWASFCTWRIKAKYANPEQKNWCSEHINELKNYDQDFSFLEGTKKNIKVIYSQKNHVLGIQFTEAERTKTFITTIVCHITQKKSELSFTLEMNNNDNKPVKTDGILPKPQFYKYIDNYIDKTDIVFDSNGSPVSKVPVVRYARETDRDTVGQLKNIYAHTANVKRAFNIKDKTVIQINDDSTVTVKNAEFDFFEKVTPETSWGYVLDHKPGFYQILKEKLSI